LLHSSFALSAGGGRARRGGGSGPGRIGLVYVDGHADFASPEESMTGSVASMGLVLAVGRGDTQLAKLAGLARQRRARRDARQERRPTDLADEYIWQDLSRRMP
jgi:hypothetical protein